MTHQKLTDPYRGLPAPPLMTPRQSQEVDFKSRARGIGPLDKNPIPVGSEKLPTRRTLYITTIHSDRVKTLHSPERKFVRLTKAPRDPSRHAMPILVGYAAI